MSTYVSTDGDSFEVTHLDRGYSSGPPRPVFRVDGRTGDVEVIGRLRLNGVAVSTSLGVGNNSLVAPTPPQHDTFTPGSGQTAFTLSRSPSGIVDMYVNGAKQKLVSDYTVSGSNVTWLNAGFTLEPTDTVEFIYPR